MRNPRYPASLDTLKISVTPAVRLAAASGVRPALDPGVIALEITEDLEAPLAQFAAVTEAKQLPGYPSPGPLSTVTANSSEHPV